MPIKIPQFTEVFIILKLIFIKIIFFLEILLLFIFGTPSFLTHEEGDGITDRSPILIIYYHGLTQTGCGVYTTRSAFKKRRG